MTTRTTLTAAALAVLLVTGLSPRTAAAQERSPSKPTTAEATYDHAPVTFWIAPMLGMGGRSGAKLTTNLALSLGVSGYDRLEGLDVGVIGSIANESARGVQVTSLFNYAGDEVLGGQVSAGVNVSGGRVVGAQLAALGNVTADKVTGVQVSSGFNYAPDVRGGQVSLVNVAGEVAGVQIGLVNVGRKLSGPQIGLVNVADESDAAIGLVNIVGNGQQHLAFWTSDSASVNVGLKLGGRYVYSVLAAGINASGNGQRWLAGLGIGGHVPVVDRLSIDADLVYWQITDGFSWPKEDSHLTTVRAVANYAFYRHLAVFAGPTLNVLSSTVHHSDRFGLVTGTRLSAEGSRRNVLLWPGFVAGVQI